MHLSLLHAEDWYFVCFGIGLALSVVAFLGGFAHFGLGHLGGGHIHAGHGYGSSGKVGVSPLNGFTVLAFLCWFGGAGYLLRRFTDLWQTGVFPLAMVSGLIGGGLILLFLVKILQPQERLLTSEDTEMTGMLARISGPIRAGGTGEIAYSQGGARRSSPARSDACTDIDRDTEVVVLRYERGVAYVRAWSELEDSRPDSG